MKALDVGCGRTKLPGALGMDKFALPGVDVVHDAELVPWPFNNNEFDLVHASHILEHVRNMIPVMEEIHRVLKPSGRLTVKVPYYRHETAFRDPTHVRFFTERSFDYFAPDGKTVMSTLNYYSRARFRVESMDYGFAGRGAWHIETHVRNPRLRYLLHRLFSDKAELWFTLAALKGNEDPAPR